MAVTARRIAEELGLSQSTVSRILNGDRRQRIAAGTRARVEETARRLGYQPNAVARSLRTGRTHIVGLYTTHRYDARNDFLAEILGGLQHACARNRLDLLLHIGGLEQGPDGVFNGLRNGRVDGLFLHTSPDDPLVARLSASALPVVALADPLPQLSSVTCDDRSGMVQVVDYLWQQGYRRFAFVAPAATLASVERRVTAWNEALRVHGMDCEHDVIRITGEDAGAALDRLDSNNDAPCAVSCWNDRTAYNLLRACMERGIAVPDQIAVTGFDGFLDDKLPARRLVTVQCPWTEVAVTAVDLLLRLIQDEEIERETCLPVRLLSGDTA